MFSLFNALELLEFSFAGMASENNNEKNDVLKKNITFKQKMLSIEDLDSGSSHAICYNERVAAYNRQE